MNRRGDDRPDVVETLRQNAEGRLLGSLVIGSPDLVREWLPKIDPQWVVEGGLLGEALRVIRNLVESGRAVDVMNVVGSWATVHGVGLTPERMVELDGCAGLVGHASSEIESALADVRNGAQRRHLSVSLRESLQILADPRADVAAIARATESACQRVGASGGSAKGFTLWSPAEFANYVLPQGTDILGTGLLRKSELALLVGQGGIGKSRLALWLAVVQILGRPFCGIPTHGQPLRWLFLVPENGLARWHEDFRRLRDSLTKSDWQLIEANIRCLAKVNDDDGDVVLDSCRAKLADTLKGWPPGVLVVDPWNQFVPGNENDAQDCRSGLNILLGELRHYAPESATLIVVHSRVGREQVRRAVDRYESVGFVKGSKALSARARCVLNLVPGSAEDGDALVLACGKANNGPGFDPRGLRFNPQVGGYDVDPDFDIDAWKRDVEGRPSDPTATPHDVLEAYEAGFRKTAEVVNWLAEKFGTKGRTAERLIDRAITAGLVARESKGRLTRGPKAPSPIPNDGLD